MQLISSEIYPQLLDIINQTFVGGIDAILSAGLDGNNDIVCLVQRSERQITIVIEDENDSIRVID